jgi:hypothetical protein
MGRPHFGFTRAGHEVHLSTHDYHKTDTAYQRFNKWAAIWITKNIGTMTAFWVFTVLAAFVAPSCLFAAGYIHWHFFITSFGFELLATLVLSTWLELALMPAIMVGQNLANSASDARSAKQFEDTEIIVDRLDTHTQGGLQEVLAAIAELKPGHSPGNSLPFYQEGFMVAITDGADVTTGNFSAVSSLPSGVQMAGYATGPGIAWTAQQWEKYPDAIRIDQDPAASDHTADVLDVESGAATFADCPVWVKAAKASFAAAARPGQRQPVIYCSRSNATSVVNAMIAGGVTSGAGLWLADWTYSRASAIATLNASGGPFPVVGVQYSDKGGGGAYDLDVYLSSWLSYVSKENKPVTAQVPPGQWLDPSSWTWAEATITGTGLDGKLHTFQFNPETGGWMKVS